MRFFAAILLAAFLAGPAGAADVPEPVVYPEAPRGSVTDTYFGTTVTDPYRWLEDLHSSQTVAWVKAEGVLTRRFLDAIPARSAIAASYRRLRNYPSTSAPFRAGKRWFFRHNTGLQTQSPWFVRESEFGPARPFFDPNTLSKNGTTQLSDTSFSIDGSLLAYATSSDGSDWETWHVKAAATGQDRSDRVAWSKYSGAAWLGDRGFYYSGYDRPTIADTTFAPLGPHKLWFHRLGTPQSADHLVVTAPAGQFVGAEVTRDNRYVLLEPSTINANGIAWKPAGERNDAFRPALPLTRDVQYAVLGNDGPQLYLLTNFHAPLFRIVRVDLTDPHHTVHDVVAENRDKLEDARLIGARFVLAYLHDAHSVLRVVSLHGGVARDIPLPGIGSATLAPSQRDDAGAYFTYRSYAYPPAVLRYDLAAGTQRQTVRTTLAFDAPAFVTEQIFGTSKDGTRVPVFVTHRRDMPLDGTTPTILYGYGGFDISWTPGFWTQNAMWLAMGGAYAVVTLRGGGEYGEAWHDAGRLLEKQHVFDDCIAAAQLLIDRKITSTPKLAINGGSNGGLLVGAVLTQRPDLFGAAVAEQGVLDMLRYQDFTVGKAWIPEYGSSTASADQFHALYAYSPVHNVKDGTAYPPTLVMTADHDDRVFPAHSYKFVAALQHAQGGPGPILLRVQSDEGHFAGLSTDREIALVSDFYAFLVASLNFKPVL